MRVVQNIRTNGTGDKAADGPESAAAKLVSDKCSTSAAYEC